MTEIIKLDKVTEKKIKKLIARQKREIFHQDELAKASPLNVFYDYPLKHPHHGYDFELYPGFHKSSSDIRTCCSKKSASVQTCPSDCYKKYCRTSLHPIILPSDRTCKLSVDRSRSLSTSRHKTLTCDKAVQVRRSAIDLTRSMTNLPKENLNDKLVSAANERRIIAMTNESLDVSLCRKQHPAAYDKNEVRDFMRRQLISKKAEPEIRTRPSTSTKKVESHGTTRPSMQSARPQTVQATDLTPKTKPIRDGLIVNRAEILNNKRSQKSNVTRHQVSSKELSAMLEEILCRNNVMKSNPLKLSKVSNLIGKPNLGHLNRSDDELPSFLKPKNISSYESIQDSELPDASIDGDISSMEIMKNNTTVEQNIRNASRDEVPSKINNSIRSENSFKTCDASCRTLRDNQQNLSFLESSKYEHSKNQPIDKNSFSLPKVSFDDVFSKIIQRHRKEKGTRISESRLDQHSNSNTSDRTAYESAESHSEPNSESPLSSLSDESASTCSGKSYTVTTTTEPTTTSSEVHKLEDEEQESSSISNGNDLSVTERINLIYSQRNISPSSSFTELNDKSLADREKYIKCLRITPKIDFEELENSSPDGNDEVTLVPILKDGEPIDSKKYQDKEETIVEDEIVDEEKYMLPEEMVSTLVREICDLVIINNQIQAPDQWKFNVSQKFNNLVTENEHHIGRSMGCYRRFLCDLIESTMDDIFRSTSDSELEFGLKSVKSIARFARKKPVPKTSNELFEEINPIILRTIGIKQPAKRSLPRDGILGYYKRSLDRDQVDNVALNEMIIEDDDWANYRKEEDELIDELGDLIFDSMVDTLLKEVLDDTIQN